jgi:uncharacterized protein (UPF0335 family)
VEKAPDMLKSFVERVERVQEEIDGLNGDKRDLYAEAKGNGFDVPALKKVIARRRLDPDKRAELDAIMETYEAALGTPVATRAPARAEPVRPAPIKPRPPEPSVEEYPELPAALDRRVSA